MRTRVCVHACVRACVRDVCMQQISVYEKITEAKQWDAQIKWKGLSSARLSFAPFQSPLPCVRACAPASALRSCTPARMAPLSETSSGAGADLLVAWVVLLIELLQDRLGHPSWDACAHVSKASRCHARMRSPARPHVRTHAVFCRRTHRRRA